jgi:pyoverdine/dityrosine biosynthesis protein Dit1/GNAT superfamily N-acetyltransferase
MMEKANRHNEFSFIEPLGHLSHETKIERYWQKFSGPFSLSRHREAQYSLYAGMTHFPLRYTMSPFLLELNIPNEDWVIKNLQTFIKTEFAENGDNKNSLLPDNWPINIDKTIYFPKHLFEKFFISSEWSNRINIEIPNENSPNEVANCIYNLLCDSKIGSHKNKTNNNRIDFINRIIPTIKEKSRLLFVLPGFPFKDQNRFRVPFDGNIPDFGEISFMIRLYNITQTIYQVHPYGADVVVLTDGDLYKNIFGISENTIAEYSNRLVEYRNTLNIQGAISFISLKEMIDRSSNDGVAWRIKDQIKTQLQNLINDKNQDVFESFKALVSGMKWNLETRNSISDCSDEICWKILKFEKHEIEVNYQDKWQQVHNRATNAAFEYAAVNLMLRWTNLISLFFPDAIRGTIHPKPNQFALSSGGTYAWNGVAFSKRWPKTIDDIRVVPFLSLASCENLKQVKFENSNLPCFYTESEKNINIELAKNILPQSGWSIENIIGREFLLTDINEFTQLGIDDVNFSWERKLQNESYFAGLFQFRVSHYKKYGFGIHGLWIDNKLIGQFGLQVLNEDMDQIEFVIFLGKDYTHKGIGIKLVNYLFSRCKEFGICDLYGIVRSDNSSAISLLEKVKGSKIKTVKHFNQEGVLYRINLNKK